MTKYRLRYDALSVFHEKKGQNKVYAQKGQIVTLISQSDKVAIVEDSKQKRFPILFEKLTKIS